MAEGQADLLLRQIHRWVGGQTTTELPDQQLLERFISQHDETAFETLLGRHGPLVLRVCRRILRDAHAAEDAFQATFLVLVRKAGSIATRELLANWLYGVAYRISMHARAIAARPVQAEKHGPRQGSDVLDELTGRELGSLLDEELYRLPGRYRQPFLLCHVEGHTRDQAAGMLGCSLRTLHRRLERGRELLRCRLARRGITLSAALLASLLVEPATAAVPALLRTATVQTAMLAVRGGTIAAPIASLADRGMRVLLAARWKLVLALVLMFGFLAAGAQLLHRPAPATRAAEAPPPAPTTPGEKPAKAPPAETPARRDDDPLPPGAVARLGSLRFRHPYYVSSVLFSPDGRTVVSCDQEGRVRLWDRTTGKQLRELQSDTNLGVNMALSPDGRYLFLAGPGNKISVCQVSTGKVLRELVGHAQRVEMLALSPDGKTLATAAMNDLVRIWDVSSGKEIGKGAFPKGQLRCLGFAPDGRTLGLASGNQELSLQMWNIGTGAQWELPREMTDGVMAFAYSADGKLLATAGTFGQVQLWDTARRTELHRWSLLPAAAFTVGFSPDGKTLAAGDYDGILHLWDVATAKEVGRTTGRNTGVRGFAFSPDSKMVAWGAGTAVRFWDLAAGKEWLPFEGHTGQVESIAFAPDGKVLATASSMDEMIRLWDAATGQPLQQLSAHDGGVYSLVYSPDGKILAAGSFKQISIWDPTTGKLLRRFACHRHKVWGLAFTPDGKALVSSSYADPLVYFWDPATGKELRRFEGPPEGSWSLAFSPDGRLLVTAGWNHPARLWDVAELKEVRQLEGGVLSHYRMVFSPSGRTLVAVGEFLAVRVWETATGKEVRPFTGQQTSARGVAFSPDGRTLFSTSGNGTAHAWDVISGQEARQFVGNSAVVSVVGVSPDGKIVATGAWDTTVLLWDAREFARPRPLPAVELTPAQLTALWDALGGDAAPAHLAIETLIASPTQAVKLVSDRLAQVPAVDAQSLARLIADLDNDQFAVREKATEELVKLGTRAESALRRALRETSSEEVRVRANKLLENLGDRDSRQETFRMIRVLEVLEQIGTTEARKLVATLAREATEDWLKEDARATLDRLTRRGTLTTQP